MNYQQFHQTHKQAPKQACGPQNAAGASAGGSRSEPTAQHPPRCYAYTQRQCGVCCRPPARGPSLAEAALSITNTWATLPAGCHGSVEPRMLLTRLAQHSRGPLKSRRATNYGCGTLNKQHSQGCSRSLWLLLSCYMSLQRERPALSLQLPL